MVWVDMLIASFVPLFVHFSSFSDAQADAVSTLQLLSTLPLAPPYGDSRVLPHSRSFLKRRSPSPQLQDYDAAPSPPLTRMDLRYSPRRLRWSLRRSWSFYGIVQLIVCLSFIVNC